MYLSDEKLNSLETQKPGLTGVLQTTKAAKEPRLAILNSHSAK